MNITQLLRAAGLVKSMSQARRVVFQGGVEVDGRKVTDMTEEIDTTISVDVKLGEKETKFKE